MWEPPVIYTLGPTEPGDRRRETETAFHIFLGINSVAEQPLSFDELIDRLAAIIRQNSALWLLSSLSIVNARLLSQRSQEAHRKLEAEFVAEPIRERLPDAAHLVGAEQYHVFHRLAILNLIRFILGHGSASAPVPSDVTCLGELALLVNELIELSHSPQSSSEATAMLNALSTWELNNPPSFAYTMGRWTRILQCINCPPSDRIRQIEGELRLFERRFDGLSLEAHRYLSFMIFAKVNPAVMRGEFPAIHVEHPVPSVLGGDDGFETFMAKHAVDLADLGVAREKRSTAYPPLADESSRSLNDTNLIRSKPFLRSSPDHYLIPDFHLAAELMTSGLFWTINDALEHDEREKLHVLWGYVFEEYVLDLLSHFYPSSPLLTGVMSRQIEFECGDVSGEIDAVLDFGDHVLVFEMKSSLLPADVKFSQDEQKFEAFVTSRLVQNRKGSKKALRQLADACRAVREGAVPTVGVRPEIFPVLVTGDKALEAFAVNRYFAQRFRGLLGDDRRDGINDLTVISVDELENALPIFEKGAIGWRAVLKSLTPRGQPVFHSFGQGLYQALKYSAPEALTVQNEFLKRLSVDFTDEMKKALRRLSSNEDAQ